MPVASGVEVVCELLAECERKLDVLRAAQERERGLPLAQRNIPFLTFLDKELNVYAFGAALLDRVRRELGLTARVTRDP